MTDRSSEEFSAAQFRLLADNVPALIACYDATTRRCQFANKQYARTFGRDERSIVGLTFAEIIGEEAAQEIGPQVDQVLERREPAIYERRITDRQGRPRWLEVHLLPHLDDVGVPQSCFVLISDITKHRLAEAAVRESEERLAKFMQASVEGIVFHKDGLVTDVNPPILALTGYAPEEIIGRHVLSFIAPEHVARVLSVMSGGQELTYELAILHKDGTPIPVEFIVRTMVRHGERMRMTIVRDMGDRHAAQARIQHLAHHDPLTGLPNRASLMDRLEQHMHVAAHRDQRLALLFIDLDHFKRVNDSLGHLVGDGLLRTVAQRITGVLRASDLVARFGGDEFMVLLPDAQERAQVEEVANKLLRAIEMPVDVDGHSLSVTPSIGVAVFPEHGDTSDTLIKHADTAMYVAKSRGRANCQFFAPAMAQMAYDALVMEVELNQAIERGEFEWLYQPLVAAGSGACVAVEGLLRWRHPEHGLLEPQRFLPLAEQRRLMPRIGRLMLRQALRDARDWHAAHPLGAPIPLAVNLSNTEFQAPELADWLPAMLREEQVPGRWLEIELTERALGGDPQHVETALRRLGEHGVRVTLDDFGAGHSSLAQLRALPIDRIKIDRGFVAGLPADPGAVAIARTVVQLGHGLGMRVAGEGVETPAQRDTLLALGCDELQGFLVARPMPAHALKAWLAQHAPA